MFFIASHKADMSLIITNFEFTVNINIYPYNSIINMSSRVVARDDILKENNTNQLFSPRY